MKIENNRWRQIFFGFFLWLALWGDFRVFAQSRDTGKITLEAFSRKPKIVVLLVIDQFRSDFLTRHMLKFLPERLSNGQPGGFRYLLKNGAYFPHGHYNVLQNMTGPGHAMISTGAYPYRMGIPLNIWFDPVLQSPIYCAWNPRFLALSKNAPEKIKEFSPGYLLGTTFGDELKIASADSKVVSVSLKDRSAIFLGGKSADHVLWFDSKKSEWMSGSFYLGEKELPPWVKNLNLQIEKKKGQIYEWKALNNVMAKGASQKAVLRKGQIGNKEILDYPFGVDLTTDAAIEAVKNVKLGLDSATDLLAISYSSHDYLGHALGPHAPEMEEMTLAEDRSLAKLLGALEAQLGGRLQDAIFVLTADHGIPHHPDTLMKARIDGGAIDSETMMKQAEAALVKKFGASKKGSWLAFEAILHFYFSKNIEIEIPSKREEAENVVKEVFLRSPGVFLAFSRSDVLNRRLPGGELEKQILRSYFNGRSGDIVVIPKPYFYGEYGTVDHVSSYSYDRTVPIVFTGSLFKYGVYAQSPDVIQIAPTLSFILGIIPPSQAEGEIISDIFK